MAIEIRPATEEEMGQFGLMGSYSYAGAFGDGPDNVVATANRAEWTLCAFDKEVMACAFAAIPFTMRANGNAMAFAGVTGVGTLPEYRRQGLLRKIMTQSFAYFTGPDTPLYLPGVAFLIAAALAIIATSLFAANIRVIKPASPEPGT